LDFKIKGSFGEITLDDISNKRIFNKSKYQDSVDGLVGKIGGDYNKFVQEAYKNGKTEQEIQGIQNFFKSQLAKQIENADPDLLEYLKYNVAKSPDQEDIVETLFNTIESNVISPDLFINKPQPKQETDYSLVFSSQLASAVGSAPETFFNRLSAASGYSEVDFNNDLTITYNVPEQVEDEDGNIQIQQKAKSLDLKNPGDFETFARSTFEQFGGKDIGTADRGKAYINFRNNLIKSLNQRLKENQQTRSQQQTIGVMQDATAKPKQETVKSVKEQILEIETFAPNQELSTAEKRKMNTGTDKKILAELNKQKLPITYANIDRVSRYLNINEIQNFTDTFFGQTKSNEELSAVAQAL